MESQCEIVEYPLKTRGPARKRFFLYKGDEFVATRIKTARPREYEHSAALYALMARGGSFVEVGAHIGADTVLAGDFFKTCYAFEPLQRNVQVLQKNLELNGVGNARIFAAAVSDRVGTARLYHGDPTNSGSASLALDKTELKPDFHEIETVTLEIALPDVTDVTFIHIGTEGHDMKVLQGGRDFLKRQTARPFIKMEFQPAMMSRHGTSVADIIGFLEEFRYSAAFNASGCLAPIRPETIIELFYLWRRTKGGIDIYLTPE